MAETVGVVRERERESYNLVKIVALIKDAQALSYVNNTDSSDSLDNAETDVAVAIAIVVVEIEQTGIRTIVVIATTYEERIVRIREVRVIV